GRGAACHRDAGRPARPGDPAAGAGPHARGAGPIRGPALRPGAHRPGVRGCRVGRPGARYRGGAGRDRGSRGAAEHAHRDRRRERGDAAQLPRPGLRLPARARPRLHDPGGAVRVVRPPVHDPAQRPARHHRRGARPLDRRRRHQHDEPDRPRDPGRDRGQRCDREGGLHPPGAGAWRADARGGPRGRPRAPAADPDDHRHHRARAAADGAGHRPRRRPACAAGDRGHRRSDHGDGAHAHRRPRRIHPGRGRRGAAAWARRPCAARAGGCARRAGFAGGGARDRVRRRRPPRLSASPHADDGTMIRLSIRRSVAVSMAYFAVALLGVAAWRNLPIEFLPDTRLPRLIITADWRGASPETTEAFLTSPLEAVVQQVRGVEKVTSESRDQAGSGRAQITVEFAHGTDMDFARLELAERITSLLPELPPGVSRPQISPYVPREFEEQNRPFLSYTLTGPYTLEALRAYVDDVIAPELRQVDGVAAVEAYGGRARVLEIRLDEAKIQALGITPDLVRARLQDLEVINEAGVVNGGGVLRTLAIRERAASVTDVLRLPLMDRGGRIIRVQDVGTVHDTYEEAQSYYRIDGKPAVSFNVHKAIRTNAVRTADRVKERLAA